MSQARTPSGWLCPISIFITDRLFSSIDEEGDGQPRGKVPRHIEKGPETQLKTSKLQNLGKLKANPFGWQEQNYTIVIDE